ncbi:MAG: hypothetical protein NWP31_05255 [Solirubrobacteraceae bacterium]|nr:hypothetical protein [Solirubrobacteraceae bacterium]MDP4673071.1 hypothetical protein [Solirubrobacteraceae bacterium]MDP5034335.1 hypothetical protein [Solirubrobacteraceae bacterium]
MTDESATPDEPAEEILAEAAAAGAAEGQAPPSEEEMRAAYEAELKNLRVEDLVAQTVVSLLNLGARKAGLLPGTEDETDPVQVGIAIEGIRRLLPLIEPALGENAASIKDALAQLQVAFTKLTGEPAGPPADGGASDGGEAGGEPDAGAAPEPEQKPGGGLWTPGP